MCCWRVGLKWTKTFVDGWISLRIFSILCRFLKHPKRTTLFRVRLFYVVRTFSFFSQSIDSKTWNIWRLYPCGGFLLFFCWILVEHVRGVSWLSGWLHIYLFDLSVMRGCDAAGCVSVFGADNHNETQKCISRTRSGCSPFPWCWDRGMNEFSFTHGGHEGIKLPNAQNHQHFHKWPVKKHKEVVISICCPLLFFWLAPLSF